MNVINMLSYLQTLHESLCHYKVIHISHWTRSDSTSQDKRQSNTKQMVMNLQYFQDRVV